MYDSLEQLAAAGMNLFVSCGHLECRRYAVLDGKALLERYQRKGWSTTWAKIPGHLRCTQCWQQAHNRGLLRIEATRDGPTVVIS